MTDPIAIPRAAGCEAQAKLLEQAAVNEAEAAAAAPAAAEIPAQVAELAEQAANVGVSDDELDRMTRSGMPRDVAAMERLEGTEEGRQRIDALIRGGS